MQPPFHYELHVRPIVYCTNNFVEVEIVTYSNIEYVERRRIEYRLYVAKMLENFQHLGNQTAEIFLKNHRSENLIRSYVVKIYS